MYTQCPRCETIFRLSAEVLRAAAGQVRCGRCGEAFNALERLAERPEALETGESLLDLETRADRILESSAPTAGGADAGPEAHAPAPDDAAPDEIESGVQFARLEILESTRPDDGSLEFTLPPGELDRIFIAPAPTPLPLRADESPTEESSLTSEGGDEAAAFAAQSEAMAQPPEAFAAAAAAARLEIAPMPSSPPALDARLAAPRPRAAIAYAIAAVLLTLLLAAQLVNRNREYIAAHTPFGGALRALYAALGLDLPVPGDLSAYELRQWGVTGDPSASGTLRVRASILNTATRFQPFPLLRVTLTDRFGNRVGMRDFEPREYLGKSAGLMSPGQRTDVTIGIVDPGKDAEGFEIDVCLRGAADAVRCATDATPHPR